MEVTDFVNEDSHVRAMASLDEIRAQTVAVVRLGILDEGETEWFFNALRVTQRSTVDGLVISFRMGADDPPVSYTTTGDDPERVITSVGPVQVRRWQITCCEQGKRPHVYHFWTGLLPDVPQFEYDRLKKEVADSLNLPEAKVHLCYTKLEEKLITYRLTPTSFVRDIRRLYHRGSSEAAVQVRTCDVKGHLVAIVSSGSPLVDFEKEDAMLRRMYPNVPSAGFIKVDDSFLPLFSYLETLSCQR